MEILLMFNTNKNTIAEPAIPTTPIIPEGIAVFRTSKPPEETQDKKNRVINFLSNIILNKNKK